MFIYAQTYRSSVAGSVVKAVTCEKCQCRYHYQLVRRGSGASSAMYGIGGRTAAKAAEERARKQAQRRLRDGVDPVACPDCGWYQAPMVRELRRRQNRWMDKLGWVALCASLVVAFFYWTGACNLRAWDRLSGLHQGRLLCILAAGLATLAGLMTLRRVLWRTAGPNAAYPNRPDPIPGMPVAFKQQPGDCSEAASLATDSAGPALQYERRPMAVSPGGWVTVQLARIDYPQTCCCCLNPTTAVKAFKVRSRQPVSAPVRICPACAKAFDTRKWQIIVGVLLVIICVSLLAAAHGATPQSKSGAQALLVILLSIAALAAGLTVFRHAISPVRFRSFSPELNTVRVRFRNQAYTVPFADVNAAAWRGTQAGARSGR